mmetsp:Transcript_39381/g.111593  ORF Transcript_39381/g.111593 Transcript_39381/m.111593 type:complete len:433 (-) Transcript_39381:1699-2997(-)
MGGKQPKQPSHGRVQWMPTTFSNENGAYIFYQPEKYEELLQEKVDRLTGHFQSSGFLPAGVEVEVCPSKKEQYRSRAKFGITVKEGQRCYVMWDYDMEETDRVYFKQFPLATPELNALMLKLLETIDGHPLLAPNLVRVNFLCATTGDAVVTLLYNQPLASAWEASASELSQQLSCSIMARSREEGGFPNPRFWEPTCTVGRSFVNERYQLRDGRVLRYMQPEGSFSNPNASVCIGTLEWLSSVAAGIADAQEHDFLELYCGNGNHTVALGPWFRRVVGIELDAALVKAANENLANNGVHNAHVFCRASGNYCSEVLRQRKYGYRRAKQERNRQNICSQDSDTKASGEQHPEGGAGAGESQAAQAGVGALSEKGEQPTNGCGLHPREGPPFNFRTVLVDPPRSGAVKLPTPPPHYHCAAGHDCRLPNTDGLV